MNQVIEPDCDRKNVPMIGLYLDLRIWAEGLEGNL